MQALFTIISIIVSLMTGGFVDETGGPEADPLGVTSSSHAEVTSDGSPEGSFFGSTSTSQEDDSNDLGAGPDPWG